MFGFIKSLFGSSLDMSSDALGTEMSCPSVNPATGLPMIDGCDSVDVAGNPFGTDLSGDFSSASDIGSLDSSIDSGSSFDTFDSSIDSGSSFDTFDSNWD